jgi:ribosomal-protein-alanine N-acetyltransferase
MKPHPVIRTRRLLLREFQETDAPRLAALGGERRIADTTISVPHPYSLANAAENICRFRREWTAGAAVHFAVCAIDEPAAFVGYIALCDIDAEHLVAELSFWISEPASNQGFVTEAGFAVIRFAFDPLHLNRICAFHMVRNAASAKVLAKLGMREEGRLRQRVLKWNVFEDVLVWAVLRSEWTPHGRS